MKKLQSATIAVRAKWWIFGTFPIGTPDALGYLGLGGLVMSKRLTKILLVLAVPLFLAACSGQPLSTREKGTIFGGVVGAGTGAIIGSAVGAPGAGAAIGGALGAGTGF